MHADSIQTKSITNRACYTGRSDHCTDFCEWKGFLDTEKSSHESAIVELVEQGIISGYEDGTFKPNKTLSRSDVVKMMGK
ncbi:hypothetical protein SporoP8_12105 [Sporosarcina ureae]|uniref:S-layer homology domain-containing protein n=1 Tax=Sporosarcina ureae TaxID=1571 RepID=UPI000A159063|nr:S-layer homology domain-containing protein [Sporosarcina ureae]ARJ39552.1 hypothetical protein SporoP8_12105 [Sporosarcina ureae]